MEHYIVEISDQNTANNYVLDDKFIDLAYYIYAGTEQF